jgi:hypothetical protein
MAGRMAMFDGLASWRGGLWKVRTTEGNVSPHRSIWPGDRRRFQDIERSVLKGERNNVLDPFEWIGQMVPSKTFGNNNFDSSEIISGVPIALR